MVSTILFVNHRRRRCGVHEFGNEIGGQMAASTRFNFVLIECDSIEDLLNEVERYAPAAIVFNYHPTTMPWAPAAAIVCADVPTVGVIHDVTTETANAWTGPYFDRLVTHDPDLRSRNPLFVPAPRPVPRYRPSAVAPDTGPIRVGSFGFASPDKGFEQLVQAAQDCFDECVIRLHLPTGDFSDSDGALARKLVEQCRALIHRKGVSIEAWHEFISRDQLLEFLASNHINALFYEPDRGLGGISSAADLAMASGRPMALRRGKMFRAFDSAQPSIFIDELTLAAILANGTAPLQPFLSAWTQRALIDVYEQAVASVLNAIESGAAERRRRVGRMVEWYYLAGHQREMSLNDRLLEMHGATMFLREQLNAERAKTQAVADQEMNILDRVKQELASRTKRLTEVNNYVSHLHTRLDAVLQKRSFFRWLETRLHHKKLKVPHFNTLLDDAARAHYEPCIATLWRVAPETMKRKIARANVQQGFMLAAVEQRARSAGSPNMLCVGSFEDTACLALQTLGYQIDAIDPEVNADLASFCHDHPEKLGTYGVVFATSVLEHVPDDEQFVRDLMKMTAVGGSIVLTCDYRDDWTPDQPKPSSDIRIYTTADMHRLIAAMEGAKLVDEPDWQEHTPDFTIEEFGRILHYGFATLVVIKT